MYRLDIYKIQSIIIILIKSVVENVYQTILTRNFKIQTDYLGTR